VGNQLFEGAEIIAHRAVPGRMKEAPTCELSRSCWTTPVARSLASGSEPSIRAPSRLARQLQRTTISTGSPPVPPTTLFEDRLVLDLDGTEAHLIHVGPGHQVGDTIVHVPREGVLFAGDVIFRSALHGRCGNPRGVAAGSRSHHLAGPDVIVPGHGPVCGIEGRWR